MSKSASFGTDPIGRLLRQQAVPASVGFLIMSIYGIVDTIFLGRWVGSVGIAVITVVLPITFLMSSFGMAVGIGGASVISRSFGSGNKEKAYKTFGNQVLLTGILAISFVSFGFLFMEDILSLFGGKGDVLQPAIDYFKIILYGIPFLAWAMMSNNVIRAEGYPKVAMYTLIIPAVLNLILDPIFIAGFGWGIKGAAWATTISYIGSGIFTGYFFLFGKSGLRLSLKSLVFDSKIVREIASIGSVTLARQGTISILAIILNNALYRFGGEPGLSTYGIINRVMLFANFPVIGITQGFIPIVGYNFGANKWDRVKKSISVSIKSASYIAFGIFVVIMSLAYYLVSVFTPDMDLISQTTPALRICYIATPLLAINLIGSAYYQAIGKALPALLLTLTKQGFFLIPLILILPRYFGLNGIWISFPIADLGAAVITLVFLRKQWSVINLRMAKDKKATGDKERVQLIENSEETIV